MNFFDISDGCLAILGVLYFLRELLKIVCFLVPMGLIVMIALDFAKGVISSNGDNKKILNLVIKRLVFAVFIFILPETVFGLFNILLNTNESHNCWTYVNETSVEDVRELLQAQEEALNNEIKKTEAEQKQYAEEKLASNNSFKNYVWSFSSKSNLATGAGVAIGQTYNLTDEQLKGIAHLCQKEQGNTIGAAAEASLMANRFEIHAPATYNRNGTGLYEYIKNAKWWYNAPSYMTNYTGVKPEIVDAVKTVLVLGKRTLPLYVDEHDCIDCGSAGYDIISIVNNGTVITNKTELKNHANYIKDVTIINNKYTATYTFHSFPTETSDPFGYTDYAKQKIISQNNK